MKNSLKITPSMIFKGPGVEILAGLMEYRQQHQDCAQSLRTISQSVEGSRFVGVCFIRYTTSHVEDRNLILNRQEWRERVHRLFAGSKCGMRKSI